MALAAAIVVVGALCLHVTRGMTFWYDDWNFAVDRRAWNVDAFLAPHNEHLMASTAALYKLLFVAVGSHYTPFRVAVTLEHLLLVALVALYLRRRVGTVYAVAAALLVLCLGVGYEVILWPVNTGFLTSLVALIAVLLALDRRADVAACALLALALASSSVGIPVLVGVAIEVLARPDRRARWWIVAVPAALYLAWRLGYHPHTKAGADNVRQVVTYGLDSAAAAVGGLVAQGIGWGRIVGLLGLGLVARALLDPERRTERALALLAIPLTFWALTALTRAQLHEPGASRYVYVGGVLVVLAAGELARDLRRPRPTAAVVVAAITAIVCAGGLLKLRDGGRAFRDGTKNVAAELGAAQVARGVAPGSAQPDPVRAPQLTLARYFPAADDLGAVGWSLARLRDGPVRERQAADAALQRMYALRTVSIRGCGISTPLRGERRLAPGDTLRLRAPGHGAALVMRRFAPAFAAPALRVDRGVSRLTVPRDRAPDAWAVAARPDAGISVCR